MARLTDEEAREFPNYAKACAVMEEGTNTLVGEVIDYIKSRFILATYPTERYCWLCSTRFDEDDCMGPNLRCPVCSKETVPNSDNLVANHLNTEQLVSEFFEIDYAAYQREREEFLNRLLSQIG